MEQVTSEYLIPTTVPQVVRVEAQNRIVYTRTYSVQTQHSYQLLKMETATVSEASVTIAQ
jgi:hypothetical protein